MKTFCELVSGHLYINLSFQYIGHSFFKQMRSMTRTEMEPLKIHLDSNKERHLDSLELAGKMVDKHIIADSNFPSLTNLMQYNVQGINFISL